MRKKQRKAMALMFSMAAILLIVVVVFFGKIKDGELSPKKEKVTTIAYEYNEIGIDPKDYVDLAEYKIEKMDHSILDGKTKKPLIEIYYEKVNVLYGRTEPTDTINKLIENDYNKFLVAVEEENFAKLKSKAKVSKPWHLTYTAEVTNNEGGILSIKITKDRLVGSAHTTDYYGMTFNINTGKMLTLKDITHQSESGLKSDIQPLVWEAVKDNKNLYPDAEYMLNSLEFYEYLYYIQDGEVIVTLPTYTIGDDKLGAVVVETGKMAY